MDKEINENMINSFNIFIKSLQLILVLPEHIKCAYYMQKLQYTFTTHGVNTLSR